MVAGAQEFLKAQLREVNRLHFHQLSCSCPTSYIGFNQTIAGRSARVAHFAQKLVSSRAHVMWVWIPAGNGDVRKVRGLFGYRAAGPEILRQFELYPRRSFLASNDMHLVGIREGLVLSHGNIGIH